MIWVHFFADNMNSKANISSNTFNQSLSLAILNAMVYFLNLPAPAHSQWRGILDSTFVIVEKFLWKEEKKHY